jgi:integrase
MKSFADFLDDLSSQLTKNGYMAAMFALMDAVYGTSKKSAGRAYTPAERKEYIKKVEEYLKEDRNFYKDLIDLKKHIERKAPRTIRSYLYNCKTVIETCTDYNLTKTQEKSFKISLLKGTRKPISKSDVLTHETIRAILGHASIPARAAILIMATSGIRIGELVKLEIKHFDLTRRKVEIPAYVAKTKEMRITYITQECAEAINTWLKFRPQYMEQVSKQCVAFKPTYQVAESRMFPVTATSLRNAIDTAVNNAGLKVKDENTHRSTILPHSFRKWFSTVAGLNMTQNPVEIMMGHELPYAGAYTKLTEGDIQKIYRKHESCLYIGSDETVRNTIDNVSGDMQKVMVENAQIKKDYDNLKKVVSQLVIDKMMMKEKPESTPKTLDEMIAEMSKNIRIK